jgi:predicted phage terminase large subunit-like protein
VTRYNPATGRRVDWEARQPLKKTKAEDPAEKIRQQIAITDRQVAILKSRDSLIDFIKYTMPDVEAPNDVHQSRYKDAKHHRAIARVVQALVKGEVEYPILILTCPPRNGKSEIVSRRLPAWLIGLFPHENGVVATYSDDFAADFGKEVRHIVQSPQFKQVFPSAGLRRGGAASDRLQTTSGGLWAFVGRGGALTGKGAHCFPAGTLVETRDGTAPIERVRAGQEVLSYDERNGRAVWRHIKAVARRPKAGLYRVTTAAGRVVEATGDHRFYANGEWIEARRLAAGDRLVRAVRGDVSERSVRGSQAHQTRTQGFLLLERLLGEGDECDAVRRESVRKVWGECAEENIEGCAHGWPGLLLEDVPACRTARGTGDARTDENEALCSMQHDVLAAERGSSVLRSRMRIKGARGRDGRRGEPALEGWGLRQSRQTARDAAVSRTAPDGHAAGRRMLRSLSGSGRFTGPSHRREPAEQSGLEPSDALSVVPHEDALFSAVSDTVSAVEDLCREADVYDIQVEGTECFFANGVLAHNCLIVDDLIKDDKEAQSQAIRDQAWNWFTKVAMTRRMGRKIVILTFTRWHSDDPIGRLTDPENPYFNRKMAERIKVINFPAIAEDDDPLGRKPGEPLWPDGPDKFDLAFLEEQRSLDPLGFAALYQQRPSLLDGDLFKRENIRFYKPGELPETLRIYGASDHAVATGQRNDFTVLLKFGVDVQSNIYLLDCFWQKAKSDIVVEALLGMARGNMKPLVWWAEKGHISKSIGPFLRKRMLEAETYMNVREITPTGDKATRAQSMVGRVAMGKLFFPVDAVWTERAVSQMMAFPNAPHDDFVDALSLIGLGLQSQFAPADKSAMKKSEKPQYGTLNWVKLSDKWARQKRAEASAGGF